MEFGNDYFEDGEPRPRRKRRRKPKPRVEHGPAEEVAAAPRQEIAVPLPSLLEQPSPLVTELHLLRPQHGSRPIDWLWRLSTYFLQCKRKPWKRLGCVALSPLVAFRERLASGITDQQQEGFLAKYQALYDAYEIAKQPLDYPIRQALELLILGGLPVDEIARMLGIQPAIVIVFEQTFFDVRSRLTDPGFVVCEAIRYHDHDPLTQQARELRHMAYVGGRHVAIALVNTFCFASRAESGKAVTELLREDFLAQLCCKAAVAVRMLPLGDAKARKRLLLRFIAGGKRKARQKEQQSEQVPKKGIAWIAAEMAASRGGCSGANGS